MDQRPPGRSHATDPELPEGTSEAVWDLAPVLAGSPPHVRSTIVEQRSAELPPPNPDRPSLVIPPVRELIRPLAWAFVPAVPVAALLGWQPAVIVGAAAVLIRELDRRVGRANASFGDGFLTPRPPDARPTGVQEDDDVRWNWTPARHGTAPRG
jgi:hypothetical protein